ncbi:MAG: hypothetical protein OXR62_14330 [Ahrensia sp.]|nr:hypothetical protein [Ahrensia sp.]
MSAMRVRLKYLVFLSLGLLVSATTPAFSCEQQANQVAKAEGGRLLAVNVDGEKCVIRLLIERKNQPPQRKTVVVDRK